MIRDLNSSGTSQGDHLGKRVRIEWVVRSIHDAPSLLHGSRLATNVGSAAFRRLSAPPLSAVSTRLRVATILDLQAMTAL